MRNSMWRPWMLRFEATDWDKEPVPPRYEELEAYDRHLLAGMHIGWGEEEAKKGRKSLHE